MVNLVSREGSQDGECGCAKTDRQFSSTAGPRACGGRPNDIGGRRCRRSRRRVSSLILNLYDHRCVRADQGADGNAARTECSGPCPPCPGTPHLAIIERILILYVEKAPDWRCRKTPTSLGVNSNLCITARPINPRGGGWNQITITN